MPLLRYFLFVGGTLLALLLMADGFLPKPPMPAGPVTDLSTIRIHTDHKWPTRVVFDTSMPAVSHVQTAQAGAPPIGSPPTAEAPATGASAAARQAFAQLPAAPPGAAKQIASAVGPARPGSKARPSRRMARRNPAPPMVLVAQHPPFGVFW